MAGEQAGLSEQLEQLWRDIEKSDDDGSAALAVLVAGHPIYYIEGNTPPGLQIKEYLDRTGPGLHDGSDAGAGTDL
jgi:hypothetical protein